MALRLPPDELERFLKEYKTTHPSQYGVVQREYVVVPDALLSRTGELRRFFEISRAYVESMKPKATAKKQGGAAKKVK